MDQKFGVLVAWNMRTFTISVVPDVDPDTFAPTGLDIDQWLDAAVSGGAKYAMLTVKHHDGFVMWPTQYAVSGYSPYSIAQTTWYANNGEPDVLGLFIAGCLSRNLKPCVYYSVVDYTWETRTGNDETTDAAGYIAMIKTQLSEILAYGNIYAVWFDGWKWATGYEEISWSELYNYVKSISPSTFVIDNNHEHPVENGIIEVFENPIAPTSIPDGYESACEEVKSIRTDNHWFWFSTDDHTDGSLETANYLNTDIQHANANAGNFLLGIQPNQAGVLEPATVTRLGQLFVPPDY